MDTLINDIIIYDYEIEIDYSKNENFISFCDLRANPRYIGFE